jgi:hypothetical protein
MRLARTFFAALLIANFIAVWPAAAAPAAQGEQATITSPRESAELLGVVQITGTATDPKFDHYELSWATQSAPDNWQTFATVQNQVTDGSLGTWDTSQLQPGVYRLRLMVYRKDGSFNFAALNSLSINQSTPTPAASPTPPVGPTIPPSPTTGAAAATPTVVIVQPPTSTPQLATTAKPGTGAGSNTPGGPRTPSLQINFASFGQAFCNGVIYTFLIFFIWGIVVGVREIGRWALRRWRTPPLPKG